MCWPMGGHAPSAKPHSQFKRKINDKNSLKMMKTLIFLCKSVAFLCQKTGVQALRYPPMCSGLSHFHTAELW